MPLEATHIRFALDLQDKYNVKNINQYMSGAIYPDSRYVTGIDKKLTHDDKFLLPEFAIDDFRKGWQVHQICDLVYNYVQKKLFPELFPRSYDLYNKQDWIASTALKIILDIDDAQAFDIQKSLEFLDYAQNPNGEDISSIENYNKTMVGLYKDKKITTVEENIKWLTLGPSAELKDRVRVKAEEFLTDQAILVRVKSIYEEMIKSYLEVVDKRILDRFGRDEI